MQIVLVAIWFWFSNFVECEGFKVKDTKYATLMRLKNREWVTNGSIWQWNRYRTISYLYLICEKKGWKRNCIFNNKGNIGPDSF